MATLLPLEIFWRDLHPWLQSVGYELRPRFRPGWVPSWLAVPSTSIMEEWRREDRILLYNGSLMDVVRIQDGKQFMLKRIPKHPAGEDEFEIIAMRLLRPFDSPRFDAIGECGLQFIHSRHVAHRDCTALNLMIDALDMNREFTGRAKYYTRTQCPPKYYWIDFGQAVLFDDEHPQLHVYMQTTGEGRESRLYDSFPIDVYYLGNMVRTYFLEGHGYYGARLGLEFMKPLIDDMRPNINECVSRLEDIVGSLTFWKLRSQITHSSDNVFGYIYRFLPHWYRRISHIIGRIPPIPSR
ncbi:hypothetical protein CPB84DRAFT_1778282 [Gymnopilus junonius]|uniref:Protein kinase domain-containing protein n=1 Tax=Gymnopilus junonius TaxID=109634 RepID=A0A9P5NL38_GYMJU|nr:hypothetical protein CPB84DRAFT_1778282 [Gymnopilus junonius]